MWAIQDMKTMEQIKIIAGHYKSHNADFQANHKPYSVYGAISRPHVVA